MKKSSILLVSTLILLLLISWTTDVQAGKDSQSQDSPVVHVVMFWLSTCGHCEYVINEVLPPLQDQYGDQLEILLVELVTQEDVDTLYETANLAGVLFVNLVKLIVNIAHFVCRDTASGVPDL